MTGRRVLSEGGQPKESVKNAVVVDTLVVDVKAGDVIKRLTSVVDKLHEIKKLNNLMQGQFAVGSPSWHVCETIDDRVHEVFVLLGE